MKNNLFILFFLFLTAFSTQALAKNTYKVDRHEIEKFFARTAVNKSPSVGEGFLKKYFVKSSNSNYDPMDVFGIITFLMQYSKFDKQWNYEKANLTWEDMSEAISGDYDIIVKRVGHLLTWEVSGTTRVLVKLGSSFGLSYRGNFDGKYFKNLRELSLHNNLLDTLDLSKNMKLETINCFSFTGLWTNGISGLFLPKSTNLETIICSGVRLRTIDVSNCINLKKLNVCGNALKTLDVSQNNKLEFLDCGSNYLTSLDVSKNANLKELHCSINYLTSLDISNTNINFIIAPKNFFKFSTLKGDFSKLTSYRNRFEPQAIIDGGTKGYFEILDLASEYSFNDSLTTYKWYDMSTMKEVSVFAANGTFYAGPANAGKTLKCHMTNPMFPRFVLEYKVTISNKMSENVTNKSINVSSMPEGFKLQGTDVGIMELKVYPNPATEVVKINTFMPIGLVTIYDYSGREIKRLGTVPNNEINVKDLASGGYILAIQTQQGIITKKFIKK